MLRRSIIVSSICMVLASSVAMADMGNISKVNRGISVPNGETAGNLDTVNGSISIGNGAIVRSAETVNGSITIDDQAKVESAETVNGSIRIGAGAVVMRDAETVNGSVMLGADATVQGAAETVNGSITLDARAHVAGGLDTVTGDIDLGPDSRVEGGIHIDKPTSSWFSSGKTRTPKIVIGPRAVVTGDLVFEREVELYVHDTAKVSGKIVGATAKSFSGDKP